jgi:hypothetical protein
MQPGSLLPIAAFLVLLGSQASAQDPAFWRKHITPLAPEDLRSKRELPMLDSMLGANRFFFTAERHYRAINTELQYAFLVYLHQRAGVRTLILETGYSYGHFVNQYMETGDPAALRKIFAAHPVCPQSMALLFDSLRRYNLCLPPQERIRVVGIDLEYSPRLAMACIESLLPKPAPAGSHTPWIERLRHMAADPRKSPKALARFLQQWGTEMMRDSAGWQQYWGDQYPRIQGILRNAVLGRRFSRPLTRSLRLSWQRREAQLYRNFLSLAPSLPEGNYYAQFGAIHTYLGGSHRKHFTPLAQQLSQDSSSPVQGQVLSIARYLHQPQHYRRLGERHSLQYFMYQASSRYPGQVALCHLGGADGPFPKMRQNFPLILWVSPDLETFLCE